MSFFSCISKIAEHMKGELTEAQAADIVNTLQRQAEASLAMGKAVSIEDAIRQEAKTLIDDLKRQAIMQKRAELKNLVARQERRGFIDARLQEGHRPDDVIQAQTVGVTKKMAGGKLSVDSKQKALHQRYLGGFIAALRDTDLLDFVKSRAFDRQIAQELWALTAPNGQPGLSKSADAQKAATIIHKFQRQAVDRMNRAGADIGQIDGYITAQSHNGTRMRRAGYETWRDSIIERLDPVRTFQGADPETFLKSAYDSIISGKHLTAGKADTDRASVFKGMGNIAKKASQSRSLHFKSADDFMDYNEQFGNRDLIESIVQGFENASRTATLLESYGTNPRAAFDSDIEYLQNKYRGNPDKFKYVFGARLKQLQNQFDEIDGTTRFSVAPTISTVASVTRSLVNMMVMGGTVISAITDIPGKAAQTKFMGKSLLSGYANSLESLTSRFGSKEKKILGDMLAVGIDGMSGAISGRFSATDMLPGTISKLQRLYYKLNLLTPWTDAQKTGFGMMLSRDLALSREMPWDGLHPQAKAVFEAYGIKSAEWDAIRAAAVKAVDDKEYITPDALQDISDETVLRYLGKKEATAGAIQKAKDSLESKLGAYISDNTETAVLTPGARERAILIRGTQPGDITGEVWRFFTQLKSFPTTYITKVLGRNAVGRGSFDMQAMAHTLVASMIFGYLANASSDLVKGKTQRPVDDYRTWSAAFVRGGGAGIYGDFFFGSVNRFGADPLVAVLGPTAGKLNSVQKIAGAALRGDDFGAQATRELVNSIPGNNIFYVRTALDYMILYDVQERLNPGYLRRMEKRMKDSQGNGFMFPPSQYR